MKPINLSCCIVLELVFINYSTAVHFPNHTTLCSIPYDSYKNHHYRK